MNVSSKREGRRAAQGTFANGLKAVLAAVLTVVLVLQGSNLQAYADDLLGAQAPEDEVIVSDVIADDETEGEKDDAVVTDEVEAESGDEDVVTETESETPPAAETEETEEAETPKATTTSVEPQLLSTTSAQPTNASTSSRELVESRVIGIGETWDIETSSGDSIVYSHRWSSNNNAAATVSNSGVVTGKSAGTAVITHSWGYYFFGWHEAGSETFSVVVLPEGSYKVWLYSLLPNMDINADAPADMKWNGMGQAVVSGVNDPSTYEKNTALSDSYTLSDLPTSYPQIEVDGKPYQYAAPGSGNENKAGYYTLEWERLVVADGANAGNNGYNEVVGTGTPTFHLDGLIQYNIENRCNVTFKVQMPNSKTFETQTAFNVAEGTSESKLSEPAMGDKIVNGITYEFDGWYKDQGCTIRAEFDGAVNDDVTYYGRYTFSMATLSYDPNGGSGFMTTNAAALGAGVWVAENEFTRDGYVFTGWNTKADGSGTDYDPNEYFPLNAKTNTLYAQWTADVSDFKVDDVEWYYDGTSHGVKVYGAMEGDKVEFIYEKSGQPSSEMIEVSGGSIEADGAVRGGNGLVNAADSGTVEVKLYRDGKCVASDSADVTIMKRQITLTSATLSKTYDGTDNFDKNGVTVSSNLEPDNGGGWAKNEGATYDLTAECPKNVGATVTNTFDVHPTAGTNLDNYDITTVVGTLEVTPATITVTAEDKSKVEGTDDPALTSTYSGVVNSEVPGWTGSITRDPGEAPGTYDITQGTLALADNAAGNFKASNYSFVFTGGTLTITAADDGDDDTPVTPVDPVDPGDDDDNPGGGGDNPADNTNPGGGTGVTPGGGATTGGGTNPVPVAATTGDDADDAEDEEAIEEDETPLADGAETDADGEEIADDDTPLTSGETNDQTCMMHWAMLAGIAASAVYFVLSAVNTRRATSKLASFEDDVLGRR